MRPRIFTPEVIERIKALRAGGEHSRIEIARELGLNEQSLKSRMTDLGLTKNRLIRIKRKPVIEAVLDDDDRRLGCVVNDGGVYHAIDKNWTRLGWFGEPEEARACVVDHAAAVVAA